MKKILLATVVPVFLAVFLGAPYYLGSKARETLTEQHRVLTDTFFFDVVSHQYDQGWFSSTETTVMRFHPTLLSNICLLYTSPSPRDATLSRMPSSA